MKIKIFTDRRTGFRFKYFVSNVNDYIKLEKDKKTEVISSYKKIFKVDREKKAQQLAKDMFTDMMKMMAADMIERNDAVVFPYRNFGYMCVSDVSSKIKNPRFDVLSGGKIYGLKLGLDHKVWETSNKFYRGRFNQENRHRIMNLVQKGHKY